MAATLLFGFISEFTWDTALTLVFLISFIPEFKWAVAFILPLHFYIRFQITMPRSPSSAGVSRVCEYCGVKNAGGGIRGLKPPVMMRPVVENVSPTQDLLNSFGPQEGGDEDSPIRPWNKEDRSYGDDEKVSKEKNDVGNTLSAKNPKPLHNISCNGSFRREITSWQKGKHLGKGPYGIVYEGISDDGFFFAIKEVSLSDEKRLQLEQEIFLLSQFEHENIVRYLGTDKDDDNIYVFLELMTKGSLATLYNEHKLRDSQVSAFTRQILNGLKYLHDRKVVHRYKKDT